MPVEYFIRYKGLCYDVGTRLKFKAISYNYYWGIKEGVIEQFIGTTAFIRADDGLLYEYSTTKYLVDFDKVIVEIINPIYYIPETTTKNNRNCPPDWDIEIGWIWYIVIMVVGTIFNARLMIWVLASAYFFLWKSGFLNGGKK
jgi:hypothetical protein